MVCPNCGTLNNNEDVNCRKCAKQLRGAHMKGKIACYIHANREAITSCGVCGHRLCGPCTVTHNGIDYCDSCAPADAIRPSFEEDFEGLSVLDTEKVGRARLAPRAVAFLIDIFLFVAGSALFGGIAFLFRATTFVINPSAGASFIGFWIFVVLAWVVYNVLCVGMTGQTLGAKVAHIIVLKPNGTLADFPSAVLRGCAALLSLLPLGLGYLWAFFDPARETWHDKLAGTAVFEYEEVA